jgi:hypothetical protein
MKPPVGDPNAKKDKYWLLMRTLYGLHRSPRHWYNKIMAVLNSLGLKASALDPCLFTGSIIGPSNPTAGIPTAPLTLGIYVDDFVYFSENPEVKRRFEQLLANLVTVEFMGNVDWFLGTHFQWSCPDNKVSVHLSQTGFAVHLVEDNNATHATSPPMPLPTTRASLSMHVPNLTKLMTAPPSSNTSADTKVSLAPLAGWHKA